MISQYWLRHWLCAVLTITMTPHGVPVQQCVKAVFLVVGGSIHPTYYATPMPYTLLGVTEYSYVSEICVATPMNVNIYFKWYKDTSNLYVQNKMTETYMISMSCDKTCRDQHGKDQLVIYARNQHLVQTYGCTNYIWQTVCINQKDMHALSSIISAPAWWPVITT